MIIDHSEFTMETVTKRNQRNCICRAPLINVMMNQSDEGDAKTGISEDDCITTRWAKKISFGPKSGALRTKFAQHKVLESIA